jgi:hypothetical protein
MVSLSRQLFLMGLVLSSAIGLILCQYSVDNLFRWLNGAVYALQLMPEAKLLTDSSSSDHQAFSGNYFSLSIGFGVTLLTGILYGLFFRANQKQGGALQGFKCLIIVVFMAVATLSFLKPYLHLSTAGEFRADHEALKNKF